MTVKTLTAMAFVATILCGCNPDDTKVTVNASALKAAAAGYLATAEVKLLIKTNIPYESPHPEMIKRAAIPHLGEDATIEIREVKNEKGKNSRKGNQEADGKRTNENGQSTTEFTGTFKIPVGTDKVLQKAPRSIFWLKYTPEDKMFRLVHGPGLASLNSALRAIDGGSSLEYPGGYIPAVLFGGYDTTINVVNDDTISLGVAAVTVNGRGIIADSINMQANSTNTQKESVRINYGNEIYSGKAPCFMYGGFQTMSSGSPGQNDK